MFPPIFNHCNELGAAGAEVIHFPEPKLFLFNSVIVQFIDLAPLYVQQASVRLLSPSNPQIRSGIG